MQPTMNRRPNIIVIMTDPQRADLVEHVQGVEVSLLHLVDAVVDLLPGPEEGEQGQEEQDDAGEAEGAEQAQRLVEELFHDDLLIPPAAASCRRP